MLRKIKLKKKSIKVKSNLNKKKIRKKTRGI
jgi:hypothetical protein